MLLHRSRASSPASLAVVLAVLAGAVQPAGAAAPAGNGPALRSHAAAAPAAASDWGRIVADSVMRRQPDARRLPWKYSRAFLLYGIYLVHRRTGDDRYLRYVTAWADAHVDADGAMFVDARRTMPVSLHSLDNLMPGRLLLVLYEATGQRKYRLAADRIRARFLDWPRTADGGFWHTRKSQGRLWADGTYMGLPFLVQYAATVGDAARLHDEAARQLLVYARHLQDETTGLLRHAYDERGQAPWADPTTRRSPEFWCRAIGWYAMALTEVLEALPADHVRRPDLLDLLAGLVAAIGRHQDPATGRWFQVVDKGALRRNWVETSCSAMLTYATSRAVERGHVPASHQPVADRGYRGVLDALVVRAGGRVALTGTSAGTVVGDLAYYLARPRIVDDPHGIGAFLIMHEQVRGRAP